MNNTMFDVAFSVLHEGDPEDVPLPSLLEGMRRRLEVLSRIDPEEALEAFGIADTYEEDDGETTQPPATSGPFSGMARLDMGRAPETDDPDLIAQRMKRARESGIRNFGPLDGVCWSCGKQIFSVLSGTQDITGCPLCHRTYCD